MTDPFNSTWPTVVAGALKRRKWTFGLLFLGLTLVALGFGTRQQSGNTPIVYTSRMKLLVTPPQKKSSESAEKFENWFGSERLLKHLILSEEVLERTVQAGALSYDWQTLRSRIQFTEEKGPKEWFANGSILLSLTVQAETAEDSERLGLILNEEFVEHTRDLAARELIASRKLLEQLALERNAQIEKVQQSILAWRNKHDIWDLEAANETQSKRVQALEAERETLLSQAQTVQGQIDQQRANSAEGHSSSDSEELRSLAGQKSQLDREIRALRQIYTEGSSTLQRKLDEYSDVANSYDRALRVQTNLVVSGQESKRNELLAKASRVEAELSAVKQNKGLAKAQVELQKLQYELSVAKNKYEEAVGRIDETRVQEQVKRNEATFVLVERPTPGAASGGPQSVLNAKKLGSGLFLSLLLSLGLTFGWDYLLQSHSLRNQIETLGLTLLSVLPQTEAGHLGVAVEPKSLLADQVRRLIVGMKRKDSKVKSVLVTSCWPSEGKSFVASNLAASLTKFGLSVTLVDADIRKPFLTTFFQQKKSPGLREAINEKRPLKEFLMPTEVENLSFIPAGTGDISPTELFSHASGIFEGFADSEDKFLIIDSAPLSVCSDSVQLSDEVEAVILVLNSKHWTARAELEYLTDLEEQGVDVFGVVLNQAKESELTHAHSYGYKRVYGQYYTQDPEEE